MLSLRAYKWPENEAELHTILGNLAGRASTTAVKLEELAPMLRSGKPDNRRRDGLSEKDLIIDALWRNGFSRTKAAEALGISRKTLYNKIRKYELSG